MFKLSDHWKFQNFSRFIGEDWSLFYDMGVGKGAACAAFAALTILVGAACRTNNFEENACAV